MNNEKETPPENPFERKGCRDCAHLKAKVTWWCMSDDAFKARRTRIPGVWGCPFWQPDWDWIKEEYRTPENGYVPTNIVKTTAQKVGGWWEAALSLLSALKPK